VVLRTKAVRLGLAVVVVAAIALAAAAVARRGDDGGRGKVVARVAGVPITEAQLEHALERERARRQAAGGSFPDRDSDEFKALRHRLLERLVLDVEIVKSANRLHVAVPTAAVYEFAEEASEASGEDEGEEAAAFERSAVRARLLYEAIARKVTARVRVSPREVEREYARRRPYFRRLEIPPARARVLVETQLLQIRQAQVMRRWVARMRERFRPSVHYTQGY
jgi:SurA N-terminal domain